MESKTVFKIGMKVYDSLNYPNFTGTVVEIKEGSYYGIIVSFKNSVGDIKIISYTPKGNIIDYSAPTLSTSPYIIQGFEQKASIPTYEEAKEWFKDNRCIFVVDKNIPENIYLSEEYFRAFEALKKLIILRDYYNQGWIPDWNDFKRKKFCIRKNNYFNSLIVDTYLTVKKVLYFKSEDIVETFMKEQEKLLKQAIILL
jgi:hypothetical protein